MEKILTFPCCFFYRVLAPLDIVELDRLAPCDMTLLVQDIDRVLGICQVCFKWCPSSNTTSTVPSSTSSPEIHGRCRELLPTLVVTLTYMPRFHTSQELGMIQYNEGIASLSLQISSRPSLVKPLSIHGLQPQTVKVGTFCLHSSLGVTLRLLVVLNMVYRCFGLINNVWTKYSFLSWLNPIEQCAALSSI
jgi:hypothetical protein